MDVTEYVLSHRERALLIGDHGSYRTQLSRQLKTLQKRLGRSTAKNAKFSQKPIAAEDIGGNPEFAHIILLTAERAWAHAMYMKSLSADDSTAQMPSSRRSHIVSRLAKAAKQADSLVELLKKSPSKASKIDWLEAKAYAHYLEGSAELENRSGSPRLADKAAQREKWSNCLLDLAVSRIIYAAMLKKTKKEHFKEIISGYIDPAIRLAAYQSQIPRTVPVTEVARKFFPEDETEIAKEVKAVDPHAFDDDEDGGANGLPKSIEWRSRKANIVDASIGQAMVTVTAAESQLKSFLSSDKDKETSKSRAAAYDEVLIASQDAVDTVRHSIEEHEKDKIPESDPRMQDLRVTSLALNYEMIGWRVGRNRVLIGVQDGLHMEAAPIKQAKGQEKSATPQTEGRGRKLAKLRERVVLYDAILQSIDSVKELRGAVRDAEFVEELDARRAYFQALKCLNIAYSHSLLGNFDNTLALLLRAESLSSHAQKTLGSAKHISNDTPLKLDVDPKDAKTLQDHLTSQVYRYNGLVDLLKSNDEAKNAVAKDKAPPLPMIRRMNEYSAGGVDLTKLVTYPPKIEPVPVKPIFFDLAWNYIKYPGQESGASSAAGAKQGEDAKRSEEQKPTKKGWFGFSR
ncbi:hypothetical protein BT63DRAFT_271928 [Microthyrium microscopicum]|uniref:Signal recognition particle subunit SRP68 n=1 Tax=Microthyrium microscopicum TaxID=703497 RepID=A0A6A6U7W5_9PEZI|nr:hypothetical protein BT63DRAFT_271928 [Microthyrium microscopicum]